MQSNVFWDSCANFTHIVESILVALKEFDGKGPDVWEKHGLS